MGKKGFVKTKHISAKALYKYAKKEFTDFEFEFKKIGDDKKSGYFSAAIIDKELKTNILMTITVVTAGEKNYIVNQVKVSFVYSVSNMPLTAVNELNENVDAKCVLDLEDNFLDIVYDSNLTVLNNNHAKYIFVRFFRDHMNDEFFMDYIKKYVVRDA